MPVHIYGHPADLDPLLDLADRHGLAIIEDAAQAHGCEYLSRRGGTHAWRRCGGLGTLAAFSFYANKPVTTGEGGMVLTDDAALDAASLAGRLRERGVDTRPFFLGLHQQPALHARGLFAGLRLPVTERLSRRGLYLPSGAGLTEAQIDAVAGAVKAVLE